MSEMERWLRDELARAEEEAIDSHEVAMNSYGAGYDRGYADAIKAALDVLSPP